MTAPLLSPMDPAILAAWAFMMGLVSLVAGAFLYGWFLDYRVENNTRMDRIERKMTEYISHLMLREARQYESPQDDSMGEE